MGKSDAGLANWPILALLFITVASVNAVLSFESNEARNVAAVNGAARHVAFRMDAAMRQAARNQTPYRVRTVADRVYVIEHRDGNTWRLDEQHTLPPEFSLAPLNHTVTFDAGSSHPAGQGFEVSRKQESTALVRVEADGSVKALPAGPWQRDSAIQEVTLLQGNRK